MAWHHKDVSSRGRAGIPVHCRARIRPARCYIG
jgi:hypothetical protein